MPGDYFRALDRLEAQHAEYQRMKDQPPPAKADRFAFLKAARDACLIEVVVALVFFACAFAALTYNGAIVWP